MKSVFVVGLIKSMQRRVEAEAKRHNVFIKSVIADVGRKGSLHLLPVGQDPKHAFDGYLDKLNNYAEGYVVVLPYAEIPPSLDAELSTFSELGGIVVWATNGIDGWPLIKKGQSLDTVILNNLYDRLMLALPISASGDQESVSDFFRKVRENNKQLLIADSVFETCDGVAPYRKVFLKDSLSALIEFVTTNQDGRIDAFFRSKGITHAQTGGIKTTLTIFDSSGGIFHEETSTVHLKKGDATTQIGAARLYYQLFRYQDAIHIAILYAGPHPERDVNWSYNLY